MRRVIRTDYKAIPPHTATLTKTGPQGDGDTGYCITPKDTIAAGDIVILTGDGKPLLAFIYVASDRPPHVSEAYDAFGYESIGLRAALGEEDVVNNLIDKQVRESIQAAMPGNIQP